MDRRPDATLLDQWIGSRVILRFLYGIRPSEEEMQATFTNPEQGDMFIDSPVRAAWAVVYLDAYNQYGVEVHDSYEFPYFLSWGAVLYISAAEGPKINPQTT